MISGSRKLVSITIGLICCGCCFAFGGESDDKLFCGHWAIIRSAQLVGIDLSFSRVLKALPSDPQGSSMADLAAACSSMGLQAQGFNESVQELIQELSKEKKPSILHVDGNHYVVVAGTSHDNTTVEVYDGESSRQTWTLKELSKRWDGNLLQISILRPVSYSGLTFDSILADQGEVGERDRVKYTFPFVNATDSPVTVTAVVADCGCSRGVTPYPTVAAHSRGAITIEVNPSAAGREFFHQIVVKTNCDAPHPARLVVAGTTRLSRALYCPDLSLSLRDGQTSADGILYISSASGSGLKLLSLKVKSEDATLETKNVDTDKLVRELNRKGGPRVEVNGGLRILVTLKSNHPLDANSTMSIVGRVEVDGVSTDITIPTTVVRATHVDGF